MPGLSATAEPSELGLDPVRLDRIATHFDRYVAEGKLSGFVAAVARNGETAWVGCGGQRASDPAAQMTADTVFRIYSMTKPITTVAAMRLFEEGHFKLTDEVAPIIGAFANPRVYVSGPPAAPKTAPSREPLRIWHLMTHTAGLTYGFQYNHNVDAIYRNAGYEWLWPAGTTLEQACDQLSEMPLLFEPGTAWNYSMATDVLGRVIECITNEPLDRALQRLVLEPLGMNETAFWASGGLEDRLGDLYVPNPADGGRAISIPETGALARVKPSLLSGGGGLVATPADYKRFTGMLLGGGALDGVRLLSPRTLSYMTRNHLPDNADLEQISRGLFSETQNAGVGFGLGFSVVLDPRKSKIPTTEDSFGWGGAASTAFWVDPREGLEVSFFTQLLPSSTYPLRQELSQLVYAALVD